MKMGIAIGFLGLMAWAADPVSVVVTGNERMQFQPNEIRVKPGTTIELVFENISRISNFPLNLVVLRPGVDVGQFGNSAMSAGDREYIPESMSGDVLAHTPVINAGQKATIRFTVTQAGEYRFICSYPGRYSVMQGRLIVH